MKKKSEALLDYLKNKEEGFYWFLGMVYGDGNVYKSKGYNRLSIGVCEDLKDKILKNICEFNVYKKNDNFFNLYINSKDVVEWFEKELGVCGPKSKTIRVPGLIKDKKHFYEFVRGYFDADGHVSIYEHKRGTNKSFSCAISSKSLKMLEDIKKITDEDSIFSSINKSIKRMNGKEFICYTLRYCGKNAIEFLSNMYKEKRNLYLSYKFEKYIEHLRWKEERAICVECGAIAVMDNLCRDCFYSRKKEYCSCGKPALSHGLCSEQYYYLSHNKAIVIQKYMNSNKANPQDALQTNKPLFIDKMLHNNLSTFYIAKHKGMVSFAEYNNNTLINNLSVQFSEARRLKRLKPASWFKTKDAEKLLNKFKEEYAITEVYDPFAGWGARAAGAYLNGLKYTGNDLNKYLIHELSRIYKEQIKQKTILFTNKNSLDYQFEIDSECLFTCPPYWEAEDYGYKANTRKGVGESYEKFLYRLGVMCVKFSRKEKAKVIGLCIEDFQVKSKKYEFVQDTCELLRRHGLEVEVFKYKEEFNSFSKKNKPYYCLIINCMKSKKEAVVIEENSRRIYSHNICTECGLKADSDKLCRKHYSYFYRRLQNYKDGKKVKDPKGLFEKRPDLLEKMPGVKIWNKEDTR